MGLRAAWVLPDGTRVAVKPVTSREWSVRVNDVEVPNEAARSGWIKYDVRFQLPSGQAATARFRQVSGIGVWELRTGDRVVLCSGRRAFRCPSCRHAVEAYASICGACGTQQPSNDARVNAWLRTSIVRSVALTNMLFVLSGLHSVVMYRKGLGSAFASLQRVRIETQFPGQFDTTSAAGFQAGSLALLQDQLTGLAMFMMVMFGIALLAYRAPVTAASLKVAVVVGLFLFEINSTARASVMLYALFAALTWSALVTLRAATTLRARTKLASSHG